VGPEYNYTLGEADFKKSIIGMKILICGRFWIISTPLFSFLQAGAQSFESRIFQNNLRILLPIKIPTPIFDFLNFFFKSAPITQGKEPLGQHVHFKKAKV
jgi:hypothetical protein